MVDKNKVKFLQFRDASINIDEIERLMNLRLPPVFRAFITVFKPYFGNFKYWDSKTNRLKHFISHGFDPNNDKFSVSWESFYEADSSFIEEAFSPFLKKMELFRLVFMARMKHLCLE